MAKGIFERKGRHGDITYYIRYQFQGTDIKERVGRKSRGFTREMAREALRARLGEIAQGRFNLERTRKSVPFSQLARRFREYAAANWRSYAQNQSFIRYAEKEFGDTPLSEITPWRIEKWKSNLHKTHKPSSVNTYLSALKGMLSRAVEWGLLKSNAAKSVKLPALGDQRARYLSLAEMDHLLVACRKSKQPWLHPYVVLSINTGLRRGEMLSLRRSQNLDLERGVIVLRQPKTQRVKSIPLNESARRAIEELQWVDDRLFPVTRSTLANVFQDALKDACIRDFHLHDLRHTFASHLLMAGSDLATVSRLMGHANIAMTMRYAHLSPRHEAEAVAKLNAKLEQNRNVFETENSQVVETQRKLALGGFYVA